MRQGLLSPLARRLRNTMQGPQTNNSTRSEPQQKKPSIQGTTISGASGEGHKRLAWENQVQEAYTPKAEVEGSLAK